MIDVKTGRPILYQCPECGAMTPGLMNGRCNECNAAKAVQRQTMPINELRESITDILQDSFGDNYTKADDILMLIAVLYKMSYWTDKLQYLPVNGTDVMIQTKIGIWIAHYDDITGDGFWRDMCNERVCRTEDIVKWRHIPRESEVCVDNYSMEAVLLQAKPKNSEIGWIDIYPSQLNAMIDAGHEIRVLHKGKTR